jgi:hypothetical protein
MDHDQVACNLSRFAMDLYLQNSSASATSL